MSKLSRRDFLQLLKAGATAVAIEQFLAACGQKTSLPAEEATPTRPAQPTPTWTALSPTDTSPVATTLPSTATLSPTATAVPPSPTPQIPDLVVARHAEPEALVRKAMAALGGMERFVPKGAWVIVKPNICVSYHTYEYAATTNPWVVATVVKMALEAGAKRVQVMDAPFGGTLEEAYAKTGIQEQVKKVGGEIAYMPGYKYVNVAIPQGKYLKKYEFFDEILKADVVINVPIAKHHSLAGLTLGMKNLLGVVKNRQYVHGNMGQGLADISSRVRPALTVVDAVRILTANGPTGGDLNDVKKLDTVIISADIIAADSYATTLFGKKPEDMPYIVAGAAMGLGKMDLSGLKIEEINAGA